MAPGKPTLWTLLLDVSPAAIRLISESNGWAIPRRAIYLDHNFKASTQPEVNGGIYFNAACDISCREA